MKTATAVLALWCSAQAGWAAEDFFRAAPSSPQAGEVIYLLMPDRFARDADAPPPPDRATGVDPAEPRGYHGGNLAGIARRLDYLQHLGVTSLWLTPVLKNLAVQEGAPDDPPNTGYHGYWITDFTDVDPHLGTKADLHSLFAAAAAHHLGMIFDVVVNHTAHVITPADGARAYQYKFSRPYLDADGKPFDDRDFLGREDFPRLDPEKSFPIRPTFRTEGDRHLKRPDWLNDLTVYHNRGEAGSSGESAQYGSVAGLDDLFLEQGRVAAGMTEIYARWVEEFKPSGLRLDTVKHVHPEFWQSFVPAMQAAARRSGSPPLFVVGEIYDQDPAFLSEYVHRFGLSSVLDFGFQKAAVNFASGVGSPRELATFFAKDAYYATPASTAGSCVTFISNHDIGRIGWFIETVAGADPAACLQRVELAHALLFCARGIPCIYYGDEQGFTGKGGDVWCREDMYGTATPGYAAESRLGGGSPEQPAYDEAHPLYRLTQRLAALRKTTPALQRGTQVTRVAGDGPGVFAFSRLGDVAEPEVLVVANNAAEAREADLLTETGGEGWRTLFEVADGASRFSAADGKLRVTMAPLDLLVLQATAPARPTDAAIAPVSLTVSRQSEVEERWGLVLETTETRTLQVAFGMRRPGEENYRYLGTSDAPPYRLFPARDELPDGDALEFRAEVRDRFGGRATADATWRKPVRRRPPPSPRSGG